MKSFLFSAICLLLGSSPVSALQSGVALLAKSDTVDLPARTVQNQELSNRISEEERIGALQELAATQDVPKVQFSFRNAPWDQVIRWIAEEANCSLEMHVSPPEGTFDYTDSQFYEIKDALDEINKSLYVSERLLIRNRQKLHLIDTNRTFPEELIETVLIEELETRGKYEVFRTIFDLKGLESSSILRDIEQMVDRRHSSEFRFFQTTGKLVVRETGQKLRTINELISAARARAAATRNVDSYQLKYKLFEEVMPKVRSLMGMSENSNSTEDGSLRIVDMDDMILLKGTPEKIAEFKQTIGIIDIDPGMGGQAEYERPFLRTYVPVGDVDLASNVLNTMCVGRDIKMAADKPTGTIFVTARTEDHEFIQGQVDILNGDNRDYSVLTLKHITATTAVGLLQQFFGQTLTDAPGTKGPIFTVDSNSERVIVNGKPQEIAKVNALIAELDVPTGLSTGIRKNSVFIPAPESNIDRLMMQFEDTWGTTNRSNVLRIVFPEDRKNDFRGTDNVMDENMKRMTKREEIEEKLRARLNTGKTKQEDDDNAESPAAGSDSRSAGGVSTNSGMMSIPSAPPELFQDEEKQENDSRIGQTSGYQPPRQRESVPGADVIIRRTVGGFIIESDDLDAVEDAQFLAEQLMGQVSEIGMPEVFPLSHRKAIETKSRLEAILGISSGSSGGGGGGGLIPGLMSNALGMGGDMFGSLLGGGSESAGSTSPMLEGSITITTDVRFNALFVTGATVNDLQVLRTFIDFLDQPDAPHEVDLAGQTFVIPIFFRDPEELKTLIETVYPDYFPKAANTGGNAEAAAQAEMMRGIQQMMRGGGGGGGGGGSEPDPEKEKMTATLGVDKGSNSLIVTGPETIYLKVADLVATLDQSTTKDQQLGWMEVPNGLKMNDILGSLKSIVGDQLSIVPVQSPNIGGTSSQNNSSGGSSNSPSSSSSSGADQAAQAQAAREAFIRAMSGRGGGNSGGRGGRGNSSRGGSSRGGFDRGGGR